jgi:protein-S-isoprenylcysteine O-methyltransferase Ste14
MEDFEDFDDVALEAQFDSGPDHVNLKFLPPYYFVACFMTAIVLELVMGMNLFRWQASLIIGLLLIGPALILFAIAVQTLQNAKTSVSPDKPTTVVVEHGPYAFSRNPIYLALSLLYLGLVVLFDIVWGMVLFVPLIYCIIKLVIEPEETYLARKFRGEYSAYKARVRRWL